MVKFAPEHFSHQILTTVFAHNGWKALANGGELPITKVGGVFVSVPVLTGISEIHLSYVPTWRLLTLINSSAVSLLLAGFLLVRYGPLFLNRFFP